MMKIYNKQGSEILSIIPSEESYRVRKIMGEDALTLQFSLFEHKEIPLGSYVEFQGEIYTLFRPVHINKHHSRNFDYTAIFEAPKEVLSIYKLKDLTSSKLKFTLTVKPHEFIDLIVANLNQRDFGWTRGECVDEAEKPISFNHVYLSEALQMVADEFNTEYEISGKEISLKKIEYNKTNPLALSYGRGNGFRTGVKRENFDLSKSIDVLYVQGGERNIDFSKYGSKELLLPKNQTLEYEGKTYITDSEGFSIQRIDNDNMPKVEDSLDCTHIYPKREGVVTQLVVVDVTKNEYDIIDNTIPESLNYSDYRIAGEKATIKFESGILAGKEFDLVQTSKALTGYKHEERRFQIVAQEYDGMMMPNETFKPKASTEIEQGDRYAIFNIYMPDAYVCDDASKEGASWDMFREAVKYLYENELPRFSFTGELDPIYAKKNWLTIGGKIRLGGYVEFTDEQFQKQPVLIRIVGIKDFINSPYKPEIELSNVTTSGGFLSTLNKLEADEVIIDKRQEEALQYTKRSFRDAQETTTMLQAAFDSLSDDFGNFTGSVSPLTVETMQLIVGDESLQFRFVSSMHAPSPVSHSYFFQSGKFSAAPAILQHMTLGISAIKPNMQPSEYKFWNMEAYLSPALDKKKAYYFYARCSRLGTSGEFLLSESPIGMRYYGDYYHFLYGILNKEYDGNRSFTRMYGYTEVLPGRITTDMIASADGETYFDLQNGVIKGNISFKSGDTYKDVKSGIEEAALLASEAWDEALGVGTYLSNMKIGGANEAQLTQIEIEAPDDSEPSSNSIFEAIRGRRRSWDNVNIPLKNGVEYICTIEKSELISGTATKFSMLLWNPDEITYPTTVENTIHNFSNKRTVKIFTVPNDGRDWTLLIYAGQAGSTRANKVRYTNIMLQEGNVATAYQDAVQYLVKAIQGSTDVLGGLVATNVLLLKDEDKNIKAGMSGLEGDNVGMWLGGNYAEAQNKTSKVLLNKDGSGHFLSGAFEFTADGKLIIDLENFKISEAGKVKIIGGLETGGSGEKIVIDENAKKITLYNPSGEETLIINNDSSPVVSHGRLLVRAVQRVHGIDRFTLVSGHGALHLGDNRTNNRVLITDTLFRMFLNYENENYYVSIGRESGITQMVFKDLPTSSSGLAPGTVYRSGNNLRIAT